MADHGMLLLSWNSHHATFCDILSRLREKASYTDVTLACEGKFYPLHKLVLSTCSEYLQKIFESTPCKHPVIVLQDVKCNELEALLNYMYLGEVNVPQSSLSLLIKAAELLQVKGLAAPDLPPSTSKKKTTAHIGSDDCSSPQAKRKKCEENTTTGQRGRPQVSSSSSPDMSSPLRKERKATSEYSRTNTEGSHEIVEQHQAPEESLHGHTEDVFVEADIKEEVVEDIDSGNNLGAIDPGLNYQNQSSSYKVEDMRTGPNTGGDCNFSSSSNYDKQPHDHQEMLSHPTNAPELPVSSSEIQGWMVEGTLGGDLPVVEGYGGVGILDSSSPLVPQQHGAPLQEQQMVDAVDERTDEKGAWGPSEMPSTVKKNFVRPLCNQSSTSSSSLLVDTQNDTRKPLLCPYCSRSFKYNSAFKNHLRTHTREKPFCCPYCNFRSSQNGSLNKHVRSHSRDQEYSCSDCSYHSDKFSHLKNHIINYHS